MAVAVAARECLELRQGAEAVAQEEEEDVEEFLVEVPPGVRPGVTLLRPQGEAAAVLVPSEARPGDRLRIRGGRCVGFVSAACAAAEVPSEVPELERFVTLPDLGPDADGTQKSLRFNFGEGNAVVLPPPDGAKPGDLLRLARDSCGGWTCTLAADSKRAPQRRVVTCLVPADAVPGETRLSVETGIPGESLTVDVPLHAKPGDTLELSREGPQSAWVARLLDQTASTMSFELDDPHTAIDQMSACERLIGASRAAGASISPKVCRGSAPPLNIMGMVAREDIEPGEELFVMPASMLLSPENCERLMPEVFGAVNAIEELPPGRRVDAAHAACLQRLLQAAEERLQQGSAATAWDAVASSPDEQAVRDVWERYADMLLGESFQQHPYWRSLEEGEAVKSLFEPSIEHEVIYSMAMDVLAVYRCIHENLTAAEETCKSIPLKAGLFMHAHLAILSRVFACGGGLPALVPVTDYCNHDPAPGAQWDWDASRNAHVVKTWRKHVIGEEVKISYGRTSNVLLFRTYGFTLPPSIEPAWACVVQKQKPRELYAEFLPQKLADLTIHLDTGAVQQSLVAALNGCADNATDPVAFLQKLCQWSLGRFSADAHNDTPLRQALAALERRRLRDPASSAWWEEAEAGCRAAQSSLGRPWEDAALRVKMSEFLCLTAHLEVLEYAAGRLDMASCLAGAETLREPLLQSLKILGNGDRLGLVV